MRGRTTPFKNSVFRKEDFECHEESNPQPDITEEEFHHFETNRSRINNKSKEQYLLGTMHLNLLEHDDVFAISRILPQSQHSLNPQEKACDSTHMKQPPLKP